MTAPYRRAAECEVDLALRDAALHDLGQACRAEGTTMRYLTDSRFHAGFDFAVEALLRAGWWPHSADIETRQAAATLPESAR